MPKTIQEWSGPSELMKQLRPKMKDQIEHPEKMEIGTPEEIRYFVINLYYNFSKYIIQLGKILDKGTDYQRSNLIRRVDNYYSRMYYKASSYKKNIIYTTLLKVAEKSYESLNISLPSRNGSRALLEDVDNESNNGNNDDDDNYNID